jgi:uncharacterized protein (DUF362 family)
MPITATSTTTPPTPATIAPIGVEVRAEVATTAELGVLAASGEVVPIDVVDLVVLGIVGEVVVAELGVLAASGEVVLIDMVELVVLGIVGEVVVAELGVLAASGEVIPIDMVELVVLGIGDDVVVLDRHITFPAESRASKDRISSANVESPEEEKATYSKFRRALRTEGN